MRTSRRWSEDDLKLAKVRGGSRIASTAPGPTRLAGAIQHAPSPQKPPYKSKLELAWAVRLEAMKRAGEIDGWLYEPFTFKLAEGKRYRVDFISWKCIPVEYFDGSSSSHQVVTAYECKGWHKNYRDSLTHLSWAAQRFPFYQWKKVVRNGKSGFEVYDVVV